MGFISIEKATANYGENHVLVLQLKRLGQRVNTQQSIIKEQRAELKTAHDTIKIEREINEKLVQNLQRELERQRREIAVLKSK